NTPITGSGAISAGGTEKEMTAYGVKNASVGPITLAPTSIHFYPDPAVDQLNATFDRPAKRILLYAPSGQMVRSFALSGGRSDAMLWVGDVPNGVYYARIEFADGSEGSEHVVIQH
ncbi:MAG TPA: hypothetical protein VG537_07085, partial [Candidatus Kapabacteria bacterium]|nr:hypothetical protein [Candidatus Kapabacteria bacterium]